MSAAAVPDVAASLLSRHSEPNQQIGPVRFRINTALSHWGGDAFDPGAAVAPETGAGAMSEAHCAAWQA